MSMERLNLQVSAYVDWKRELMRDITRYRSWLAENRLLNEAVDNKLERALRLLRNDQITLAFVGEFSRGKTELINSLFFADYGQRMLPSRIGRTTMCPTELFFDNQSERPYLRLLPIETRIHDHSVSQLKHDSTHWVHIPLNPQDTHNIADAFAQVAKTKPMAVEHAMQLGFNPEHLENTSVKDQVLVPAWRHALINLDHPLLRQGLRILDTPGLNALGSEPELTLSMLPSAQAILFMLACDSGVTASDMAIWQEHIRQLDEDTQTCLYAVLNKIDTLWDDLAGEEATHAAIAQLQADTARQLGLQTQDVLPLSAKQALLGKIRKDPALLARSQLQSLEELLCERIVMHKERLIEEQVVNQILGLLLNSQHLLGLRLDKARTQQALLSGSSQQNQRLIKQLSERAQRDYNLHHKRLLALKTHQRSLNHLLEPMRQLSSAERLQEQVYDLQQALTGSWTTVGINQAIVRFFSQLQSDLEPLQAHTDDANQRVAEVFLRHNQENPLQGMDPPQLSLQRYRRELKLLQQQADQFRLHPKTLLLEQKALSRRFLTTLVQEVQRLNQSWRDELAQWSNDSLLPLIQHSMEHKQLLESHLLRLKNLNQESRQALQRGELLQQYISNVEQQMHQASALLNNLRKPSPLQRPRNVVALPGAFRQQR